MADTDTELNQSETEDTDTSGQPPVAPQSPDLEALVRSVLGDTLKTELDSRFSGLQSIQDRRLDKLARDLRKSNLTQDQQDAILEQEQERDTAKALQIAELIKRRKSAPEAVDFLLESMEKDDLDDQIAFIQGTLKPKAPAPAAPAPGTESDDEGEIPESNKNNQASQRNAALESGEDMNEELADQILDQVGKGQFGRFFGRR